MIMRAGMNRSRSAIVGFIYNFLEDIYCWWKVLIMSIGNKFHRTTGEELNAKTSKTRIRYNINKLIYKVIYSVFVAGIGTLICQMGAKLEIEYVYFNAVVFMFFVGSTITSLFS